MNIYYVARLCAVLLHILGVFHLYDTDVLIAVEVLRLVAVHIEFEGGVTAPALCLDIGCIEGCLETLVVNTAHCSVHAGKAIYHDRDAAKKNLVGFRGCVCIEVEVYAVVKEIVLEAVVPRSDSFPSEVHLPIVEIRCPQLAWDVLSKGYRYPPD